MPKVYLVPLAPQDLGEMRQRLARLLPGWGVVQVSLHARYLGFELGPGRAHLAYEKPFDKVLERAGWWGAAGSGLYLTSVAYTSYIASVLGSLGQLDEMPSDRWAAVEEAAFQKLIPGASQWAAPADFRHLKTLGFPRSFPDMPIRHLASRLRVVHFEAAAMGGLRVRRRAAALREIRLRSDQVVTAGIWASWFDRCFILQLDAAYEECRRRGVSLASVEATIFGQRAARPLTRADDRRLRRDFQRTASTALMASDQSNLDARVRHKTDRWQVPILPRHRADHARHFLKVIGSRVPPRVWAASWRAVWNGWATARRTQGRRGLPGCAFCCSETAPDSIEHYSSCRVVHEVTAADLQCPRLPTPEARLANFLGLDFGPTSAPDRAVAVALRAAAVYKVQCMCSHGTLRRGPAAAEALRQAIREAVRGHRSAAQVYDDLQSW